MEALSMHPVVPETDIHHKEPAGRDAVLRELLPFDYDYARESGLIDMFHYNPDTGEDGLLHTLGGETRTLANGGSVVEGFHHEPSADAIWPRVRDEQGRSLNVTRVDRDHLAELTARRRQDYKEYPLEPYAAKVTVNGLAKYSLQKNPETGETKLVTAKNTMYPKEYDAMAVLQTVRNAMNSRDPGQDRIVQDVEGNKVIVSEGTALLMDGKTPMRIRLILDAETQKVRTAIPILSGSPGKMKLTQEEADKHLYGEHWTNKA